MACLLRLRLIASVILCCLVLNHGVECNLSAYFYSYTCPNLEYIVGPVIKQAVEKEPRMGASLLRLFFHDCFVQGCDCSICLNDSSTIVSEKNALPNANSVRGFDVIERAKAAVERFCPGVVSCADIVALAARNAVYLLNGPFWRVLYGRRDSLTANLQAANTDLPGPNSTFSELVQKFANKGLSESDMVTLSGAHTIGKSQCRNFRDRLFDFKGTGKPDPTMNEGFLEDLREICGGSDNNSTLVPLDFKTGEVFDNGYYQALVAGKGLLRSDQEISRTSQTFEYHYDQRSFFDDFGPAMVKMGSISPLTGSQGEIRKTCSFVNSENPGYK